MPATEARSHEAAVNMILYGDIPLEEQVQDTEMMWTWAAIATVAFVLAALWLHRRLGNKPMPVGGKEVDGANGCDSDGYLRSEK